MNGAGGSCTLVKVASSTVQDATFYDRFFERVKQYLPSKKARREESKAVDAPHADAPAATPPPATPANVPAAAPIAPAPEPAPAKN